MFKRFSAFGFFLAFVLVAGCAWFTPAPTKDSEAPWKERILAARIVVVARTTGIEETGSSGWRWVSVETEATLKGPSLSAIRILVPSELQLEEPKTVAVQNPRALWILQWSAYHLDAKTTGAAYTALLPVDVHPIHADTEEHIDGIIKFTKSLGR